MDDEGMEIVGPIDKKKLILPNGQTPPTSEDSFIVLPDDSPSVEKDDSFSTVEKAEPTTPENEQEVTIYYTPANGVDETEESDSSTESPAPSPILINYRPIKSKKAAWLNGRVLSAIKCLIPCI